MQNKKNTIKLFVDAAMTVLLLCLMAYQVTGESLHEWIGIGMMAVVIAHHVLNIKWYSSLFKGKYNAYRIITTLVNTLLLASIILTAVCGMSMSNTAVPFLYGMINMVFARTTHLALSFWSFILMGFHLGLHLPAMTAKVSPNKPARIILTSVFALLAGLGLFLFFKNGIARYISFRTHFALFNYEKAPVLVFLENLAVMFFFVFAGANIVRIIKCTGKANIGKNPLVPVVSLLVSVVIGLVPLSVYGKSGNQAPAADWTVMQTSDTETTGTEETLSTNGTETTMDTEALEQIDPSTVNDGYVLISGGTYLMGSPDSENWRIEDEKQHEVAVSSFYMDAYETTQKEYARVMGENPSGFEGDDLPVENISWLDAVRFANAKSEDRGLTPAYTISSDGVKWNRSANGYRLPTEAEWEYACRAGAVTPFNTETSISTDEANYWGSYPYEIEENYFNTGNLDTKPSGSEGQTVVVGRYPSNKFGLYDMHGNVNEWCWDYYGEYDEVSATDPTGALSGTRHVYRGGGWNDFAKNLRSAYRAAGQADLKYSNLGVRLVRNADLNMNGTVNAEEKTQQAVSSGKILIVYFSWGGNTRGIAKEIQSQTGADIYEIELTHPYSTDYNTVLMEAQEDQHNQARPEIANLPASIDEYDTILLGYPNWWASIPMPIATFLESFDFSGKTIIPFCSHGGGRFGQSLTAISKLAPEADMGEGLAINYSGGDSMPDDVTSWLKTNGIL